MGRRTVFGNYRCEDGRSMRHDPQHDDPYLETDVGKCEECGGKGCDRCESCGLKLDSEGECASCNKDREEGEEFAERTGLTCEK